MLEKFLGISEENDGTDAEALYREYIGTVSFVPGPFPGWQVGEFTDEHRANMSKAASLRKRTSSHIDALHEGRRNSKNTESHKAALIASRIGTKHSVEAKKMMSEAKKNNPKTKTNASKAGKSSAQKRKESGYYETEAWKQQVINNWIKRKANALAKTSGGTA